MTGVSAAGDAAARCIPAFNRSGQPRFSEKSYLASSLNSSNNKTTFTFRADEQLAGK